MNQPTSGGGQKKNNSNRNRNKNRNNKNRAKKPGGNTNTNRPATGGTHPKNKSNRNKRKRNFNNKKLTGIEKVERGYFNLLEKHLHARKKYYELFHRADPRQLAKLEKNFERSITELREYEETLTPELLEQFTKRNNGKKHDSTYSINHELEFNADEVSHKGDFADPHYLESQINSSFNEDTEESSGSMEDYNAFKGIS